MTKSRKSLYYVIDIITIIIFYFAFTYEGAKDNRFVLLIILFMAYLTMSMIKYFFSDNRVKAISLIIKILLLLFIEVNSKYAINYFIHAVYLLIMIDSTFLLNLRSSYIINFLSFIGSMYKFINLISINNTISNISQMFLFILINSLVIVILGFAKYHQEGREKIDNLYKELLKAHKKLQDYADKIKDLTVVEERNKIARDLHDTLGHDMTGLIMQLEMVSTMMDEDIDSAKNLMEDSKTNARSSLKKVREIVETFKDESEKSNDVDDIRELVDEFSRKTGISINFKVVGDKVIFGPDVTITLYRVIQEAMTNAVRHGRAKEISIVIMYDVDRIGFSIVDNGAGCDKVVEGYGLRGMKERVDLLGGELWYESKDGFQIGGNILLK
ncbi:histidine kinase [Vallitalea longa]|uniref:histidine kinase n=1 Tax=Vallitalea longa TaxID=2936439 RepID=A0A9W5YBX8_9FIRM|nr:sensor histidine kinase [Vallitalea longa]GKX29780.1 histidine kinase [Vallitalea longa]